MTGLRIVLDGPPGAESGRFVEVEDGSGRSVDAGEWHERDDGLWELCLRTTSVWPLVVASSVALVAYLTLYFGLPG